MIELAPKPANGVGVRELTVALTGSSCRAKLRCLVGVLKGTIAAQSGLPDVGRSFSLSASGFITPLGRVSAIGIVTGVGNARFGHESLRLTLKGGARSVVLSAASAQVPAFTSP